MRVDSECNVQGGLGPAKVQDTLGYQMLLFPVSLYKASPDVTGAAVRLEPQTICAYLLVRTSA